MLQGPHLGRLSINGAAAGRWSERRLAEVMKRALCQNSFGARTEFDSRQGIGLAFSQTLALVLDLSKTSSLESLLAREELGKRSAWRGFVDFRTKGALLHFLLQALLTLQIGAVVSELLEEIKAFCQLSEVFGRPGRPGRRGFLVSPLGVGETLVCIGEVFIIEAVRHNMGACSSCVKDSTDKTAEEALIGSFEKGLGYFEFHCSQLVRGVDFLQRNGQLSVRKLQIMLETLNLSSAGLQDQGSPLGHFYGHFLQEGGFSASKLELLAVLLGSGELPDKAHSLVFASGLRPLEELCWAKLIWLLGDLCQIALEYLPEYAATSLQSGTYHAHTLAQYRRRLGDSMADTVKALEGRILRRRDSLPVCELRARIDSGELAMLGSASALRKFALETARGESTETSQV